MPRSLGARERHVAALLLGLHLLCLAPSPLHHQRQWRAMSGATDGDDLAAPIRGDAEEMLAQEESGDVALPGAQRARHGWRTGV